LTDQQTAWCYSSVCAHCSVCLVHAHVLLSSGWLVCSHLHSADGLRADRLFEQPTGFLRELITSNKAVWGVSHAHVPTESRPGHVALLAGFYEDVSAIFKGWKRNPVEFDSVINGSATAVLIGSPDIVHVFADGNVTASSGQHHTVHVHAYPQEIEDFAAANASVVDAWVLQRLRNLLQDATSTDVGLNASLRARGVVYLLHLLATGAIGFPC
jgi:phosphatidylinositol glycan class N